MKINSASNESYVSSPSSSEGKTRRILGWMNDYDRREGLFQLDEANMALVAIVDYVYFKEAVKNE